MITEVSRRITPVVASLISYFPSLSSALSFFFYHLLNSCWVAGMRLGKRGTMGVNWMPLWFGCPWSTAISWLWVEGGELGGGASGVAGRPPMDSHSPAEPTADGGEWECVVHFYCMCVRLCVSVYVRVWKGRGANWLTEWLGDCEEATAIRPALIEFDASLNSFQMEEQVLFFRSNPHCPGVWGRGMCVRVCVCASKAESRWVSGLRHCMPPLYWESETKIGCFCGACVCVCYFCHDYPYQCRSHLECQI